MGHNVNPQDKLTTHWTGFELALIREALRTFEGSPGYSAEKAHELADLVPENQLTGHYELTEVAV